jgi:type VI secretion system protein ImpF
VARTKSEVLVTQSLIDRLTDYDDWPTTRNASLRMYRDGIKRDMEWLLNSRKPHVETVEKYELACRSVFNFGLPDFSQLPNHDPDGVRQAILKTIRTHESRILDPLVQVIRSDMLSRSIRFHVDGRLAFEDGEEEISFDTLLNITSGTYEVK